MRKLIFLILGFAFVSSSFACSCMMPGSPSEEFKNYNYIFTGTVESIEKEDSDSPYSRKNVEINILDKYKWADLWAKITVSTWSWWGDCGYFFKEGEDYFVYAWWEEVDKLSVWICSRTRSLEDASEDVEDLSKHIIKPVSGEDDSTKTASGGKNLTWVMIFLSIMLFIWASALGYKYINKQD